MILRRAAAIDLTEVQQALTSSENFAGGLLHPVANARAGPESVFQPDMTKPN